MKKETLKEAAEKYASINSYKNFIDGAIWQKDKMYNDIEQKWVEYRCYTNNEDAWMFKEWLVEQFKKK